MLIEKYPLSFHQQHISLSWNLYNSSIQYKRLTSRMEEGIQVIFFCKNS